MDPSLVATDYSFFLSTGLDSLNQRGFVRMLRSLVLGQVEPDPEVVIPALTRKLAEERAPRARCAAALALGRLSARRDPRVLSALIAALNDTDPAVARCAGFALSGGEMVISSSQVTLAGLGAQADAAIPGLVRLLREEPWAVLQFWSARALRQLGDDGSPRASAALAGVLEDPSFTNGPAIQRMLDLFAPFRRPARTATSAGDGK